MNKSERAAALALAEVRVGFTPWARRFIRAMAWLAEHEPKTTLSTAQKWGIDTAVYRFRRQLAGIEDINIPESQPVRADYVEEHEHRCTRRRELREAREGRPPDQGALL